MQTNQLRWQEPKAYGRVKFAQSEEANSSEWLKTTSGIFVVLIGLRIMVGIQQQPGTQPPSWSVYVPAALALALFITRIVPRLVGLIAVSTAILSEKGVNLNTVGIGASVRFVPWENIKCAEFWTDDAGGKPHQVVSFMGRDVALLTLALDTAIRSHQIQEFLNLRGLPFTTH